MARWCGWAGVGAIAALGLSGGVLLVGALVGGLAGLLFPNDRTATRADSTAAAAEAGAPRHRALLQLTAIDSATALVRSTVAARVIPGAAVAIGTDSRVLEMHGYGRVEWSDTADAVSPDSTVYDLASLTKAVATTTAVLLLAQDGRIRLDDPVQQVLPEFKGKWKDSVTWVELLTHTSGLPAGAHISGRTAAQRLAAVLATPLRARPGTYVQYSDLSFITLWAAAQRVAGEPLPRFLERRVWKPLGMNSTSFWPGLKCDDCAPTELLRSGEPYRGKPSDPIAHNIGIPTGNAGLFSTAHDLARFAQMIVNGGELHGKRILEPDLVNLLLRQVAHAGHRTIGWEAFCPNEHLTQDQPCAHPIAYGHTGWTGTSLWIDPVRKLWVVILSNRSYNVKRPPSLDALRAGVFERAADGVDAER
jgi:CubicO group peptidase (beta-lactamase class C family)